ncbi:hypothetical protein [Roseibium salinum]|uniref:Lipoprotein n=1 Tax=Roseibium salinum TaxID=1604349 RepID=A0ABT3R3Q7_9HYPH|nr:hypothetical protein [Roseibium sp. DSM 29163]MCX2723809.1 hypothetical protein [Roseibium sp. DSM 29163]
MISAFQAVAKSRLKTMFTLGICAAALSGCGAGSDSVAGKIISGGQEPIEISPETFAPPVSCPPMQLKTNTFLIMKYARGKEDQAEGLLYQATIEDWANTCTQGADGQRQMKAGFSGNVTPGPAWQGGEVILPLRIAIVPGGSGAKPLSSEVLKVPVTLGAGAPSEKWTLIEGNLTVPANESVKVVFGFDEGGR